MESVKRSLYVVKKKKETRWVPFMEKKIYESKTKNY